jgi:hypothetical protein
VAARISGMVPASAVIHTDDIAWEHSRLGWADLPGGPPDRINQTDGM